MLRRNLLLAMVLWAPYAQAEPPTLDHLILSVGEPSDEQVVTLVHQHLLEHRPGFESELVHYVMTGFGDTIALALSRPDSWFHRIAEMPADHAAWMPLGEPMRFTKQGVGGDVHVQAQLKKMAARFVRVAEAMGWTATGVVRPLYAVDRKEAGDTLGGEPRGRARETDPEARPADSSRRVATQAGPVQVMPPVTAIPLATAGQLHVIGKEQGLRFGFAPLMTGNNSVWSRLWVPNGDRGSIGCDVLCPGTTASSSWWVGRAILPGLQTAGRPSAVCALHQVRWSILDPGNAQNGGGCILPRDGGNGSTQQDASRPSVVVVDVGHAVRTIELHQADRLVEVRLGNDLQSGQRPRVIVPAGTWQGTKLAPGGSWGLLGCQVSPGFEFEDFRGGRRQDLLDRSPAHADLTRDYAHG